MAWFSMTALPNDAEPHLCLQPSFFSCPAPNDHNIYIGQYQWRLSFLHFVLPWSVNVLCVTISELTFRCWWHCCPSQTSASWVDNPLYLSGLTGHLSVKTPTDKATTANWATILVVCSPEFQIFIVLIVALQSFVLCQIFKWKRLCCKCYIQASITLSLK